MGEPVPWRTPDLLLGVALAWVLVCATPAALGGGLLAARWLVGGSVTGPHMTAAVFGWTVTMGVGQAFVVGPAFMIAWILHHRACAAGLGIGAASVGLVNAALLALLLLDGSLWAAVGTLRAAPGW